ncbi:hypothetical protein PENNAL_c0001G02810 [Penicillium nalgiovense]|uniref:Uncharacterized protein n=1 Tax=Penicillium nalgiovense TaxID=60175 RepID=A0A1V6ZAW3_PENNA|nr:hypothetical protein PENNAL_c0001G02810 [Penicillium nalgiovense]
MGVGGDPTREFVRQLTRESWVIRLKSKICLFDRKLEAQGDQRDEKGRMNKLSGFVRVEILLCTRVSESVNRITRNHRVKRQQPEQGLSLKGMSNNMHIVYPPDKGPKYLYKHDVKIDWPLLSGYWLSVVGG